VLDVTSSGAAEYQRLLADLEVAGVELPHRPQRVELVREAARRSEETRIPAELLYALGREGLPLDPTTLLSRDPRELRSALEGEFFTGIAPFLIRAAYSLKGVSIRRVLETLGQIQSHLVIQRLSCGWLRRAVSRVWTVPLAQGGNR
jgi:hypothetical protein